jgi:hypothetical protein
VLLRANAASPASPRAAEISDTAQEPAAVLINACLRKIHQNYPNFQLLGSRRKHGWTCTRLVEPVDKGEYISSQNRSAEHRLSCWKTTKHCWW